MSAALVHSEVSKVSWRLRQVMAHRKVKNKDLADRLGKHPTTIARLKAQDTLPEIGNDTIEAIRLAITELSDAKFGVCTLSELIQFEED